MGSIAMTIYSAQQLLNSKGTKIGRYHWNLCIVDMENDMSDIRNDVSVTFRVYL